MTVRNSWGCRQAAIVIFPKTSEVSKTSEVCKCLTDRRAWTIIALLTL